MPPFHAICFSVAAITNYGLVLCTEAQFGSEMGAIYSIHSTNRKHLTRVVPKINRYEFVIHVGSVKNPAPDPLNQGRQDSVPSPFPKLPFWTGGTRRKSLHGICTWSLRPQTLCRTASKSCLQDDLSRSRTPFYPSPLQRTRSHHGP